MISQFHQQKFTKQLWIQMPRVNIKPLSVNLAWQGRRFKTKEYKAYEQEVLIKLKPMDVPKGKLKLNITFGFSSKKSDWDNPVKLFQDCLQKKYGFDDNKIYEAYVKKVDVKKGKEFIEFELKQLEE